MAGDVQHGVSLARLTTFRVGGVAREVHMPRSLTSLEGLLARFRSQGRSPFFLGRGANVVFPDGEFARPVICTRRLGGVEVEGTRIRAEAGLSLARLISLSIRRGLKGLEGLVGIPATVGGAVAMNAGGHGGCFGDRVRRLGLLPLKGGPLVEWRGADVEWRYRGADLEGYAVAWAELELETAPVESLRATASRLLALKAATQPLTSLSAGCVFRNPPGDSAGRRIDLLGLKGLTRGSAQVSETHANFIVNPDGQARARDVRDLVETLQSRIERAYGTRLETEIVFA